VVDLVGIHSGAGNSALVLVLARALAGHGLRILAAELPGAAPGLAALAGIPNPENLTKGAWASKTPDPLSAADLLPWVPGTRGDDVRSTLEKFLDSARAGYDLLLLDSPSPGGSDIAHEVALKSDVVILVAKQDVGRFAEAKQVVELCAAAGVAAITCVLNFAEPDPVRGQAEDLLRKVMVLATKAHGEVLAHAAALAGRVARRRTDAAKRAP